MSLCVTDYYFLLEEMIMTSPTLLYSIYFILNLLLHQVAAICDIVLLLIALIYSIYLNLLLGQVAVL